MIPRLGTWKLSQANYVLFPNYRSSPRSKPLHLLLSARTSQTNAAPTHVAEPIGTVSRKSLVLKRLRLRRGRGRATNTPNVLGNSGRYDPLECRTATVPKFTIQDCEVNNARLGKAKRQRSPAPRIPIQRQTAVRFCSGGWGNRRSTQRQKK